MPQLTIGRTLLLTAFYCLVAGLGMMLAIAPANVTPIYPAAGLAWSLVIIYGRQAYPIIFIGGMLSNLVPLFVLDKIVFSIATGIAIGIGEVLSVMVGCKLLQRFTSEDADFTMPKEILALCIIGVFWVVSPSVGVSTMWLTGFVTNEAYAYTWLTWWLGDSIGILLMTPAVLIVYRQRRSGRRIPLNLRHLYLSLGIALSLSMLIFSLQYPFVFLLTLLCLLSAFWLGQSSLMLINVLIASVATYATLNGLGPFAPHGMPTKFLILQLFIATNVIASLLFWGKIIQIRQLGSLLSEARFEARKDSLTNILNRRGFKEIANANILTSRRNDVDSSLLMFDLDDFKQINDSLGHDVGDEVLVYLTREVERCIRAADVFGRIGGEEFAILLHNTEGQQAEHLAQRICQAVAKTPVPTAKGEVKITVSIGATLVHAHETLETAFMRVDSLLYKAKTSGKNCVVFAEN